jgi:hypothetical protein
MRLIHIGVGAILLCALTIGCTSNGKNDTSGEDSSSDSTTSLSTDTDSGTEDATDSVGDTDNAVFRYGIVSGGGRVSSAKYRCTFAAGATPATSTAFESTSFRLRLGLGAQVNQ